MNDGAPSLEVGLEITTGGSFAALTQIAALLDSTEFKAVKGAKEIERALGGSINLAAATTSVTTFGNAATRVEQDLRREKAATESAIERVIKKTDQATAAVGRNREEQQAARIEELALAAARQGNTDAADRLLTSVRALKAAQDVLAEDKLAGEIRAAAAATREREQAEAALVAQLLERSRLQAALDRTNGNDRSPATQSGATYSALTAKFLEDEAQAARDAARAYDLFEAAVRRGAQAMREVEAAEQQATADARQLRAALDPMFVAQQRFDTELERAERLLAAGTIGEREFSAAVQLARDNLYSHAQAVAGGSKAVERLTQQQQAAIGATGGQRAAMQGLGYQAQDTFTQLSMGGNVFSVLAIQGGQAAGAFAYAGGKAQSFAEFMLGPWGLAITAGFLVLGALTKGLFESDDAAKKAADGMKKFQDRQSDIGNFIDDTTGRLKEQNRTLVLNAVLTRQAQIRDNEKTISEQRNAAFKAAATTRNLNPGYAGTSSVGSPIVSQVTDPRVAAVIRSAGGDVAKLTEGLDRLARTSGDKRFKDLVLNVSNMAGSAILASRENEKLGKELRALGGDTTALGARTTSLIGKQVALATAITPLEKARAQLSLVEEGGASATKLGGAAVAKYTTDLTAATRAVQRAEAAEKAATTAKREGSKEANHAAALARQAATHDSDLAREAAAQEVQIRNLYAAAAAYKVSSAAGLIAEAQVKAESEAIKRRSDAKQIEAAIDRQVQVNLAQRVADGEKSAASMRDQARIQTEVNGEVAAGNVQAERAAELVQQRLAVLPLLQAAEAAERRGLTVEAQKARDAAIDLADAQRRVQAAAKGSFYLGAASDAQRQLATQREELRLVGATEDVKIRAMATLKATQDLQAKNYDTTDAYAQKYIADQVAIALGAAQIAHANDAYNASLGATADHWDIIANKVQSAGQGMADAFGSAGRAIGDVASIYADYQASRTRAVAEHAAAIKAAGTNEQLLAQENARFTLRSSGAQIAAYGDMLGAAKGFFKEGTAGYEALSAAEKVYRLAQFALSIQAMVQQVRETVTHVASSAARSTANAAEGVSAQSKLPFPFNLVAMAATAAALVAAGISVLGGSGGGGASHTDKGNTGIGTVLGDGTKGSDSIKNSIDALGKIDLLTNSYSREMAASLKSIDSQIGSFAAEIVKGGDLNASADITTGFKTSGLGSVLSKLPLIGGILGGLFGTRTDITGSGLYGRAQTLGQVNASGYSGQSYTDVEKTKKFLGIVTGRSSSTQYAGLDASLNDQFTLILQSFDRAIAAAAGPLGDATDAVQSKLDGFVVNIGKVDLKGLSGDEIEKKLENVFGALGDQMAAYVYPQITKYQQVGEGALETLTRVASTVEAVTIALDELGTSSAALGIDAKVGLAAQFDSLSDMSSAIDAYFRGFYSSEEQAAAKTAQITKVFDRLGLSMPDSLAGFRQLVEAQDLTTASGQSTYATLLQLAPAFADLQSNMEGAKSAADILSERMDLQKQLWQATGDTGSIRAAELAELDASNRPLKQRLYDLADEAVAIEAANRIAEERAGLQSALNQLLGDTAAMRADELAAIDASNRALKLQIYALQDQQAAAAAAAQADQEAAQAAAAIAQERKGIEQQLLQLQGKTAELRQRELAELDPTNRALQQQVYDLTDLQAALAAAAAIAQERAGLESQLLQLQNDTVTLRARELAELDPTNRALKEQIYALTDLQAAQAAATQAAQEAAQAAAAIAQERAGIEQQLLQLQGNTAALRERELAGLDASNRALMGQVYALQDQQAATTAAAQAEQALAQERAGLMQQLWQLTGDTASIRAAQLASLDPSNRALQEQIYAISDAQDAAKAAQALADAWKTVGDSIMDEITRIRGLGTTGGATFASLQGQFNAAVAAARGGDQDAAKGLPELSKSLLDAAALAATSRQELARVEAQTAGALQSVYDMIGSAVGASGAATSAVLGTAASNDNAGASADSWWSTFANTASAASAGGGNDDLVSEIRALRAQVASMQADNNKGHAATAEGTDKTAKTLDAVTRNGGGNAFAVEQAA